MPHGLEFSMAWSEGGAVLLQGLRIVKGQALEPDL